MFESMQSENQHFPYDQDHTDEHRDGKVIRNRSRIREPVYQNGSRKVSLGAVMPMVCCRPSLLTICAYRLTCPTSPFETPLGLLSSQQASHTSITTPSELHLYQGVSLRIKSSTEVTPCVCRPAEDPRYWIMIVVSLFFGFLYGRYGSNATPRRR